MFEGSRTAFKLMKIVTVVGARPQFIKAGPISKAIARHNGSMPAADGKIEEIVVHTGQHYDPEMSAVFFETLRLTVPKYNLGVGSGSHGQQLAKMIERLETVLQDEGPDVVVVYGDTNSTLAAALVADRLQIPIAHVEAGLRSFNRLMPEETNRVLTDHISCLLFAPTSTAVKNLANEGITAGVFLVGDVMYEAAMENSDAAEKASTILDRLGLAPKSYTLTTLHRAENTDDAERMERLLAALIKIAATQPLVWPLHPRTLKRLHSGQVSRIQNSGIRLIDPVPYLDMLVLEKAANAILTDSGGVQKEAMWFQVPCITMRDETEWVETVESGWNQIAGTSTQAITHAFENVLKRSPAPFEIDPRKPKASELIVQQICSSYSHRSKSLIAS
jgi:UDP-N-acetylglucosamine 2-epimerase